ncbi:MAG: hypothetical protein R2878_05750 [Thermoleophilia bacterium]
MVSAQTLEPDREAGRPPLGAAHTAYRRAWWSLAFFPVSLVLAFVVGEGLIALLGGGDDPPVWKVLVAGGAGMLVFALPGVAAVFEGRRAMRLGRPEGRTPAVIGAVLATGFVVLNLVPWLVALAFG